MPVRTAARRGRAAFLALVAFTVILVASPQEFVPVLGRLRIALVAAAAAFVLHLATRRRTAGRTAPAVLLAAALVGWAVLMIPASYWPGGSLSKLLDLYIKSVIVFWLLGELVNTPRRLRTMAWTLALLGGLLAATGIANYASGTFGPGAERIAGYGSGLAANPNDLALTLNIILPLTVALAVTARRRGVRLAAAGLAALGVAAIVVTFSRGGFIALLAIGVCYVARLVRRGAWGTLAAWTVGVALALAMLPAGYTDRVQTLTNIETDPTGSAQIRWTDTVVAARFVLHHPIVGAGLGMDYLALNELRGARWLNVHNAYLNYAMDLGLPGLGLFLGLFGVSLAAARRVERGARRTGEAADLGALAGAVRISLVGFAAAAFFYPVAYHFYFYYLAGLAVAVAGIDARLAATVRPPAGGAA